MSIRHVSLAALALLTGCATPSQRIANKLTKYGVPPAQARCMGDSLEQQLNNSQLYRLGEIGRLNKDRMGRMTVADIVGTLNKSGDPALVAEVLRTGLSCAM